MSIKRIKDLPEGSGSLTSDDIFLFMDDPSGSGVTKKISLSQISSAIGGGGGGGSDISIGTIDLHNGGTQSAQILQFSNPSYQAVITGPIPSSGNNAQRIIVQGQRAQGNGEGGDVYLWGGDSDSNGGDIKIYAGDADSNSSGYGGYINIDAGNGYDNGGNLSLSAGNSTNAGGNDYITAGYSQSGQAGSVEIAGGSSSNGMPGPVVVRTNNNTHSWSFNNSGDLEVPGNILLNNGTSLAEGTYDNGMGGQNGISLNCAVGYQLNWQASHLKNTMIGDNSNAAQIIYFDSPITYSPATLSVSYTSNIYTDATNGEMFDITLTGNATLENPTNPINGKTLRWRISQDNVGNRLITLGNKFNIPSSATSPLPWSTAANKMDVLAATYHAGRDKWDIVAFVPGY